MNTRFLRRLSLVVAAILLICIALPGCKSAEDQIVGYWKKVDGGPFRYLEFFSDGTYDSSSANYEGSYSISGDRLKLTGILVESKTYSFEIKDDKLYFYRGGSLYATYQRVD